MLSHRNNWTSETLSFWQEAAKRLNLSAIEESVTAETLDRMLEELREVKRLIAQAIDLVVHIKRTAAGRKIDEIVAVRGVESDGYLTEPLGTTNKTMTVVPA